MFNYEQLEKFSRECLFLRKALREGYALSPQEYEALHRDISLLLVCLEARYEARETGGGRVESPGTGEHSP